MADENEPIGSLPVEIVGDFSELQTALDGAASAAQDGSDQIVSALQGIIEASGLAGGDLAIFQSVLEADQQAGIELAQSLQDLSESAASVGEVVAGAAASALEQLATAEEGAGEAADTTANSLNEESDAAQHVSESAHEAESGLAAMAEQLVAIGEALVITEGLVEFGEEALTVYGTVQSVTIGLTQLTGSVDSANEAIEQIKQLAATEPFAFPEIAPTIQKMVALGVSLEQLPQAMQAVADASAATGNAFNSVANSFDRMSLSGTVSARSLVQLGLTTSDLAAAMNVTDTAVKQAFKDLDQSQRIDALSAALGKFAGSAEAQAQGIAGQWQIFQNEFEEVMVAVGADLAPVVSDILALGKIVLEVTQAVAEDFKSLPPELQDVAVVFGLMAAAAVPLTGSVAALGLGLAALNALMPSLNSLMATLGLTGNSVAISEGAAAAATEAHGLAAASAAGEIEALNLVESSGVTEASGLAATLASAGTAIGNIAVVVAPAVAAIAVTVENLNNLKAAWAEVDTEIKSNSLSDAINAGNTAKELQDLGFTVADLKAHFSDMGLGAGTVMQTISASVLPPMQALQQLGYTEDQVAEAVKGIGTNAVTAFMALKNAASVDDLAAVGLSIDKITTALNKLGAQAVNTKADFDSLKLGISVVADGYVNLSSGAQSVIDHIATLNQNVLDGKTVLSELKTASDGSAASLQAIAAQAASLTKAQNALNTELGLSTKAAKDAGDSLTDLATADANAQAKFDNANTSWANFMTALNNGSTTIDGLTTSANNANIAWNNLAAAYQKATGAVLQWNEASGNTAGIVQGQVNQVTNLQNAVAQTAAALKVQQDAYNAAEAAGTANDQMLQQLQIAYLANQKANTAFANAVDTTGVSMDELTGKSQDYVTIIVNGVPHVADFTNAQLKAAEQSDMTTNAIGGTGTAVQDLWNKYAAGVAATQGITTGVRNLTQAQTDAATAAKNLATQQQNANTAWANGQLVVQDFNGKMQTVNTAFQGGVINVNTYAAQVTDLTKAMSNAEGPTNEETDALIAQAHAADDAAQAVENLNSATSKSGKGGSGGSGNSLESLLSGEISVGQDPALGGAIGGGGLGQAQMDQMAQELANVSGQIVTTMDGSFIPAAQQAATLLAAQALYTSQSNTATQANTTATTANTAAVVASTPAFTVMNSTMAAAAAAGDDVVTSFAQLPSTIQDYLDSVNGTLVGYDDTTGQLEYTTAVLNSFGQATSQAMHTVGEAADELSSAGTSTAASLATVAESSTSAADSMQQLVSSTAQAGSVIAQAATQVGTASSDVMGVVQKITGTLSNSIFGNSANAATGIGSADMFSPLGAYSNPNPGLMEGYAPNDGAGSNPTIQIIVTGNFAASDSSIQMLANKVASAATTQLRTLGGLKN